MTSLHVIGAHFLIIYICVLREYCGDHMDKESMGNIKIGVKLTEEMKRFLEENIKEHMAN